MFCIFTLFVMSNYSQNNETKRVNFSVIAGYNIGATTPVPIPAEVREVISYQSQFNPQLGVNVNYKLNRHYGIASGLAIERKSMNVSSRVKYMLTNIEIDNDFVTGYFVGENTTNSDNVYLTMPVYGNFAFSERWNFKLGVYTAMALSTKFKGSVSDGYIRIDTPLGQKQEIDKATFDFSKDAQDYDFGLSVKGEYKTKKSLGIFSSVGWGLIPYFKNGASPTNLAMRNFFGTIGIMYRIN
jgi:hypothetical protein